LGVQKGHKKNDRRIHEEGPMATVLDKDFGTKRHNDFSRLQKIYGPV